jgi:glycosyltransferase involved in cell wall biosynthesis
LRISLARAGAAAQFWRKLGSAVAGYPQPIASAGETLATSLAGRSGALVPKRVLMVIESVARGGAERQMLALTQGLLDRGYAVEVLELTGVVPGQASFIDEFRALRLEPKRASDVSCSEQDQRDGYAVSGELQPYADILPARLGAICSALVAVITRFRPRVVYCWSDLASVLGGFTAAHKQVPRTILGQRTFPPPFWVEPTIADSYRQAYGALLRKPNMTMINISSISARAYEAWLGIDRTIRVVRNGFARASVTIPDNDAIAEFRRGLGIPDGAPVVGTVMRFAPEKDPQLWLRTAAEIAGARDDVHFILNGYGHDNIAEQLREMSEQLGLKYRLHMPAAIADVGRVYGALTVFLLTSRTDSTPNALLEAQAVGVPIVAPAIGGIEEAVLDGVTGVLVRNRSATALADAVLGLLGNPTRRQWAKTYGSGFVAQKFGLDRMIDETIASCD